MQKEKSILKKKLEKQTADLTQTEINYEALQQKVDGLKLGAHVWNEEDKKLLQKRIDNYLKEIDKCLQLLNQ